MLDLPVEFFSANVSARLYYHYFIPLIPSTTILIAYGLNYCFSKKRRSNMMKTLNGFSLRIAILTLVVYLSIGIPIVVIGKEISSNVIRSHQRYQFFQRLSKSVSPKDTIFEWGGFGGTYFILQKKSPTVYASLYPLFTKQIQNAAIIQEVYRSLIKAKPQYIIDTSLSDGWVVSISGYQKNSGVSSPEKYGQISDINILTQYIHSHYIVNRQFEVKTPPWEVYERKK